jgi:hypothetical protein
MARELKEYKEISLSEALHAIIEEYKRLKGLNSLS